ncbi:kinetochore sim4 complex subunit FTA2 domain-containing protein [Hirsutella rhossiliensis]
MTTWHDKDGDNKTTEESQSGRGANLLELGPPGRLQPPLDVLMVYSTRTWTFKTDFRLAMVEIESKHYALKVFMPYDISYDYHQFYTAGIRCTEEELEWHVMPFYSECRAYGRIKQAQDRRLLPHQVAVPCHGFISTWRKKTSENWRMSGTLISVLNRTTP